jgi:hypothetical protein
MHQLPLDPPVLIGFLLAPEDLVLAFAINFELPPACTFVLALEAVFLSAIFLLIANPICFVLGPKNSIKILFLHLKGVNQTLLFD